MSIFESSEYFCSLQLRNDCTFYANKDCEFFLSEASKCISKYFGDLFCMPNTANCFWVFFLFDHLF